MLYFFLSSKNPRWRLKYFFSIHQFSHSFYPGFFEKKIKKKIAKNVGNIKSYSKKYDFDPPFWIDPPFLPKLTKFALDSYC
jgi:hypothetical protein